MVWVNSKQDKMYLAAGVTFASKEAAVAFHDAATRPLREYVQGGGK